MRWAAPSMSPPWSGWADAQEVAELTLDVVSIGDGDRLPFAEAEHAQCPLHRIAERIGGPVTPPVQTG